MKDFNECLKLKLEWEKCSTNLITNDFIIKGQYQEEMNKCFVFYNNFIKCLKNK